MIRTVAWAQHFVGTVFVGRINACAKTSLSGSGSTMRRMWSAAAILGLASVFLPGAGSPWRAHAAEFEVSAGHLSVSVRDIVESHGWSLVWAADEDRVVDYPFVIGNGSLREALTDLLAIYRGQFVADLYEGNRVVLVDSAPPRIRVVLPDSASGDGDVSVAVPSPNAAASMVATSLDINAEGSTFVAPVRDVTRGPPREAEPPTESSDLPVNAGTPDKGLASRHVVG